jgi:Protein of unknown function with HXXEE motif
MLYVKGTAMSPSFWGLFLPACFVFHNVEEYLFYNPAYFKFVQKKYRDKAVFLGAQIALTICVTSLCLTNYFLTGPTLQTSTTIIAFSFIMNGLQHCIQSLAFKRLLPGTITGLLLLIPSSTTYLVLLDKDARYLIRWSLLSIPIMAAAILISLRISYLLQKALQR